MATTEKGFPHKKGEGLNLRQQTSPSGTASPIQNPTPQTDQLQEMPIAFVVRANQPVSEVGIVSFDDLRASSSEGAA